MLYLTRRGQEPWLKSRGNLEAIRGGSDETDPAQDASQEIKKTPQKTHEVP